MSFAAQCGCVAPRFETLRPLTEEPLPHPESAPLVEVEEPDGLAGEECEKMWSSWTS